MQLKVNEDDFNKLKRLALARAGQIVERKAKRNCPVDMGMLKASITHEIVDNDTVVISANADYAHDMEYGKPPEPLSENEKEEINEWAKRHGLYGPSVANKIEREGIKVGSVKNPMKTPSGYRPFLRPALYSSLSEIKKEIRRTFAS